MVEPSTSAQIVAAADRLFYERGYEPTSFADIAAAVGISRGNFYHHFKSKDAILDAVLRVRLEHTRQMLDRWELDDADPRARIEAFIDILVRNRAAILRSGCPVGTLCSELAKLDHPAQTDAAALFELFRAWLRTQFVALGRARDADALAMHVLARSQGVATLAQAVGDDGFIAREVKLLRAWLREHVAAR